MSDTPAAEDTVLVWAGPQHRRIAMTLPPFPFLPASPEERMRLTQYGELVRAMASLPLRQVGWMTQAGNVVTPVGHREQDARLYGWKPVYVPAAECAAIDAARSG